MFRENPRAARHRSAQKNGEEPRGSDAALYNGSNQEQQEGIEHDMCKIVMQELGREQTPIFVMNLTAVGESTEAKEPCIISDRIGRKLEEERSAHNAEDACRSKISAH
jgi:hypothetical protein